MNIRNHAQKTKTFETGVVDDQHAYLFHMLKNNYAALMQSVTRTVNELVTLSSCEAVISNQEEHQMP